MPPTLAVIFDMDGVITDSEPLYAEAVNTALEGTGQRMSDEDHVAIMGSSIDFTWEWVIDHFSLDGGMDHWKRLYDQAVFRLLSEGAVPTPGIYELLDGIRERGIAVGLATSSQGNWADAILARLGVRDRFSAIATCEMVKQAKPAPDLYLLAAKVLGVSPDACLAVEDTPRGVQAARRAGMETVALRTAATAHMDVSAADHVIDSLAAFDYGWLQQD